MKRWFVLLGIASTLALGVGVALPPAAADAVISPAAPNPINTLSSLATAAFKGYTVSGNQSVLAHALSTQYLSNTVTKEQAAVIQKTAGGGKATTTEAELLAKLAKKFRIPAFASKPLMKGPAPLMAGQLVYSIGGIGNDIAFDALQIDDTGLVCSENSDILAFLAQEDCAMWEKDLQLVANQGYVAGLDGAKVCNPSLATNCVQLYHMGKSRTTGWAVYCFQKDGNSSAGFYVKPKNLPLEPANEVTSNSNDWLPAGNLPGICSPWSKGYPGGQAVYLQLPKELESYGYDVANGTTPVNVKGANPTRTFKCVITGTNGSTYSATSASFTETDTTFPEVVCPDLPDGVGPQKIKITEEGGGETHILYEETITPEAEAAKGAYPECMSGTCLLELLKNGVSCFQDPVPCADWFEDPTKGETYSCRYGTHTVALSECNVYKPSFKEPGKLANPDTGETLPTVGKPGSNGGPGAVLDPQNTSLCMGAGWSTTANPLEWVMVPVQCALQWAFVPRSSVVTATFNRTTTALQTKMPGQLAATVGAWEFTPPPSGCGGIAVNVFFMPSMTIMQACPGDILEPLAFWARIAGNVTFSIYAVVAITRHVARIFQFGGLGE